jgi:hypothetical protein
LHVHLAQEGAHVGHQAERARVIAADFFRIDVDVGGRRPGEMGETRGATYFAKLWYVNS